MYICKFFLYLQSSKEEILRWEEGKKWQARVEKVRTVLKEKEKEVESLSKQLTTIKELYSRFVLWQLSIHSFKRCIKMFKKS